MGVRGLVNATCLDCNLTRLIRKDSISIRCRKCQAKKNVNTRGPRDISNQIFGKLKTIKISKKIDKKYYWLCVCECGQETETTASKLLTGQTRSCGCLSKSRKGLSTTSTFRSWKAMITRCSDTNNNRYHLYGAKGIKVCERWLSFENFLLDMGERPEGCTLDRIDNYKGYSLENCRWADMHTQSNNRRNNHVIEAFGIKRTLTEWANHIGIKMPTLRRRIVELGWPIEKALIK